jgi:hypothetical protein
MRPNPGCLSRIRIFPSRIQGQNIPDPDYIHPGSPIPDPGGKQAPDSGSGKRHLLSSWVKSLLFVVRLECCSKSCSGCCMIWAIWTSIRWHWVIYFYLKNILKHLYLRSGRSASIFRKSKNPQICGLKKICYIFLRTFRKCGNLRICGPICFCGFKTSANS